MTAGRVRVVRSTPAGVFLLIWQDVAKYGRSQREGRYGRKACEEAGASRPREAFLRHETVPMEEATATEGSARDRPANRTVQDGSDNRIADPRPEMLEQIR